MNDYITSLGAILDNLTDAISKTNLDDPGNPIDIAKEAIKKLNKKYADKLDPSDLVDPDVALEPLRRKFQNAVNNYESNRCKPSYDEDENSY